MARPQKDGQEACLSSVHAVPSGGYDIGWTKDQLSKKCKTEESSYETITADNDLVLEWRRAPLAALSGTP